MSNLIPPKQKERKLLSKSTKWEYDNRTIVHTIPYPEDDPIYFSSGSNQTINWDDNAGMGYINIPPKPRFITVFKDRCKALYNGLLEKFV